MEAASASGNPDFPSHGMAVDDHLAAVPEFDFQNTAGRQFEIDIRVASFQRRFDPRQGRIGQAIEFLVIHRATIPLFTEIPSLMSRIAAVIMFLGLTACGMKGPLELPPGPGSAPLLGTSKAAKPAPKAKPADVSTDQNTDNQ